MRVKKGILAAIPDFSVVCLLLRNFVVGWSNRGRLRGRQAGSVAIAGTLQAGDIISLMFGFRYCPGFGRGERRVVAGFKTISAFGQITAVLREGHGPRIPTALTGNGRNRPSRRCSSRGCAAVAQKSLYFASAPRQLGGIARSYTIPAIGHIALVLRDCDT